MNSSKKGREMSRRKENFEPFFQKMKAGNLPDIIIDISTPTISGFIYRL
jgi:hypothetical protein